MWFTLELGIRFQFSEVPVVRDFVDILSEVLHGVPPKRQVKFRINLVLGAALIAKALYGLAPP